MSVSGAQDQALAIGRKAHDVTIQCSIFAESVSSSGSNLPILITSGAERISFHHNLMIKGYERMPQMTYSDSGVRARDTQIDLRNNLM